VLQDVAARLDKACVAFFAGLARYPRFRRRGKYRSFTFDYTGFTIHPGFVRLSMIGDVRLRLHRAIEGVVKRATMVLEVDQWFVAFAVEEEGRTVEKAKAGQIGVDVGLKNVVALSDGTIIENPRWLSRSAARIRSLQRGLSRKKKDSHNREKAKIKLAKAWRTVSRQRDDHAHKLSQVGYGEHARRVRGAPGTEHAEESLTGIGNNGRVLGETAPIDCLEGSKARRTSRARPTQRHVAEMLWMRGQSPKGPLGPDAHMCGLRVGPR
jgi:transposase